MLMPFLVASAAIGLLIALLHMRATLLEKELDIFELRQEIGATKKALFRTEADFKSLMDDYQDEVKSSKLKDHVIGSYRGRIRRILDEIPPDDQLPLDTCEGGTVGRNMAR